MERFTKRLANGSVGFSGDGTPTENALKLPGALSKLCDLEDVEQQGRLVVLPCKVGDTVYILRGDVHNGYETVKKTHVEKVAGGFTIGMLNRNTMKMYDYYYLTRAEAEAALGKEQEHD